MHMTWPLMAVMLLTVAFVIGVGIFQSRKVRSAEGYSVGGRSAGVPMVAGGIAGTVVGGGATVRRWVRRSWRTVWGFRHGGSLWEAGLLSS